MVKAKKATLTDAELAKRLTAALAAIRGEMGWDGAECKTQPKHPGWLHVRYVLSQGFHELQTGQAEPYLEWLEAGNKGSFLKFKNSTKGK